jgi:Inner membrane component of T3SS, cytoplasmic domain/PilZ domain
MIKAVLQHPGGSVDLLEGEIVIGRGLGCPIRFNDHTVSRKHVKLIVTASSISARDLGSRNGTKLNNAPLESATILHDRDVLQVGSVLLRLVVFATNQTFMDDAVTSPGAAIPDEVDPARRLVSDADWRSSRAPSYSNVTAVDDEEAAVDEQFETVPIHIPTKLQPRSRIWDPSSAKAPPKHSPVTILRDSTELPLPDLVTRTCPDCRTQIPMAQQQCHGCGFKWRLRGPLSKTQPINISTLSELELDEDLEDGDGDPDRRAADRVAIEVPIIYHSENLTFDAKAQNLSRTGVFIASDLLDARGTPCTLRVLPDGHPAVSIGGVVKHVVTSANAEKDQVPGMGIRFQKMSRGAISWIWSVVSDPLGD